MATYNTRRVPKRFLNYEKKKTEENQLLGVEAPRELQDAIGKVPSARKSSLKIGPAVTSTPASAPSKLLISHPLKLAPRPSVNRKTSRDIDARLPISGSSTLPLLVPQNSSQNRAVKSDRLIGSKDNAQTVVRLEILLKLYDSDRYPFIASRT